MSQQRMDADTAETVAGWSGFCVALLSSSGRLSTPMVRGRLDKCRVGHRPSRGRGAEPASGRDPGRRAGPGRG